MVKIKPLDKIILKYWIYYAEFIITITFLMTTDTK